MAEQINMDGKACEISPSLLPAMPVPAMAYVPFQQFNNLRYTPEKGLESGTIFPELDKPFYGGGMPLFPFSPRSIL